MCYSLWTINLADTVLVIELFVTKNKVVETNLQLAETVKLHKNTVWRVIWSIFLQYHLPLQRYDPILVPFTVALKTFWAILVFIKVAG